MKSFWLQKSNNEKVLLFFAGWGMDQNPFLKINSEIYDVVIFYDYRDILNYDNLEIERILEGYKTSDLLAWSMGVWCANYFLKDYKDKLENIAALNGTLLPIDDNFGIPHKIFQLTIDKFSSAGRISFNKRMCGNPETFSEFESSQPQRSDEELKQELVELQDNILHYKFEKNIFNKVLISSNDKIIPAVNQLNFWKDKVSYKVFEGPHFMFDKWNCWEEIVCDSAKS